MMKGNVYLRVAERLAEVEEAANPGSVDATAQREFATWLKGDGSVEQRSARWIAATMAINTAMATVNDGFLEENYANAVIAGAEMAQDPEITKLFVQEETAV